MGAGTVPKPPDSVQQAVLNLFQEESTFLRGKLIQEPVPGDARAGHFEGSHASKQGFAKTPLAPSVSQHSLSVFQFAQFGTAMAMAVSLRTALRCSYQALGSAKGAALGAARAFSSSVSSL